MNAALDYLRESSFDVREADLERLSPLVSHHINLAGKYYFSLPEEVKRESYGRFIIPMTRRTSSDGLCQCDRKFSDAYDTDPIMGILSLEHLVMDGHFGNNNAVQIVWQCGLYLISKLRHDSALYFRYDGPYGGSGTPRKYGDKINYASIPAQYLKATTTEKDDRTDIYQADMLHKEFAQALNVVIIVKSHTQTGAWRMWYYSAVT